MKKNEEDVSDALRLFFGQFGTIDLCAQLVLEEFFKELLKHESVHIPGEPQERRDKGA